MIAGTVYTQLVTTLEGSETLAYIKRVFKGLRYDIPEDDMPCIMVEPTGNNVIEKDMNQIKDVYLTLDIVTVTYAVSKPEKAIVGDDNYKGILDIENDIRAVLQSSYTLGNTVLDIRPNPTIFGEDARIADTKYPARVMVIPVNILYRQTDGI